MSPKSKSKLVAHCYDVERYQKAIPEITWLPHIKSFGSKGIALEELNRPSVTICINPLKLHDLVDFCKGGLVHPLDEFFSKEELKSYFPPALDLCKVDGKLMAIPEDFNPFSLFSRRDLLQQHGLAPAANLQELGKQLAYLKKKTGKAAFEARGGGTQPRLGFITAIFGSFGVNLTGNLEDWSNQIEKMIEAYEWIRQLHQQKLIENFDLFIRRINTRAQYSELPQGNLIYFASWLGKPYLHWQKELVDDVHISLLPSASSEPKTYQPLSGHGWFIPANTQDIKMSIKILKKTQTREFIKANELAGGYPFMAWQELWEDPDILRQFPFYGWRKTLLNIQKGFLIEYSERKFTLLDQSFRNGIRENLKGKDWIKTLLTSEFTTSRRLTSNDAVKRALEYMEQNLSKIHNTKQVAAHLGLSSDYFNRLFQKSMKIGCADYLMKIRMERARRLLNENKLSIKEIAVSLGFLHPQGFTRAFRKHCGKSPSEIKNS